MSTHLKLRRKVEGLVARLFLEKKLKQNALEENMRLSNAVQEAETRAIQETHHARFLYSELRARETEKKDLLEQVC